MVQRTWSREAGRHTLLAAGTAFALLGAPLFVSPAEGAVGAGLLNDLLPDDLACTPELVAEDDALREACEDAGLLPAVTETLQRVTDPVEQVIGDVLQGDGGDAGVVDGVVEQVPEVIGEVVEQVLPVPEPPAEPAPTEPTAPPDPPPAAAVATSTPPPVVRGPRQGPGLLHPPYAPRTVAFADRTPPPRPFLPSVPSTFADHSTVTETDAQVFESATATPLGTGGATTLTSPDASMWLFATAAGMLLLLGAGHVVHARHRYDVAR